MIEGLKERFASIRKDSGLNVKDFAESLGMEPTTVSSIESGKREPSKEVLLKLGIMYAISINWLLTGYGEKSLPKALFSDQNKPPILTELENLIDSKTGKHSLAISALESRLSAIEERLKSTPKAAETEYPAESGENNSFTAEPEPEYGRVPFYDDVAAGPPMEQSEDESMLVDVPLRFIKTKLGDYYALRVRGNSMIDALIPDGSMVLIRKSNVPASGKIQVVRIDDRATLKRMRENEDRGWTLCHEDGTGQAIPLGNENMVQGDFAAVLPPNTRPYMRRD